ncbi:hypothetical protein TNCV_1546421 [Trichonephila clavipes]|nr:hypothetical protein TNCV_1546421 [Trichonephila clavipes]
MASSLGASSSSNRPKSVEVFNLCKKDQVPFIFGRPLTQTKRTIRIPRARMIGTWCKPLACPTGVKDITHCHLKTLREARTPEASPERAPCKR